MRASVLALAAAAAALVGAAWSQQADIVIADFEGEDYGDWVAAGTAFGSSPARGTLPNQMDVSGFRGRGLVNSYVQGDGSQGTLTSPEFTLERRYLNFLIGGGHHPGRTCVNLLVDGKVVRTATGRNSESLDWHSWDVGDLRGRKALIEIVDRESGGWGHINVDEIRLSDERAAPEIVTDVLYDETYRPQFHFTARKNWLNDPNGLVYYKGEYHLFFQHNPLGREWGNMTWGHAVSRDLVHWEQLPHALEPDRLGTMFSGSAVVDWENTAGFQKGDEKTLIALYTAAGGTSEASQGQPFTQCLAYSNDRGRTWTKYEGNPVLKHIVGGNRDPKVVWHAPTRRWIMALYLDGSDFALFASPNLKEWEHLQDLSMPGSDECPDFFEMPVEGQPGVRKWVFTAANGRYLVGSFDGRRFTPETGPHPSDQGANFYAVQTYSDIPESDGRRIQIAWMRGGAYPEMPFNQQMGFPCELKLHARPEGLRLTRMPVREIEVLRGKEQAWRDLELKPGDNPLSGVKGDLFDIEAEIDPGSAEEVGLRVRGEAISYSPKERKLTCLERSAALEPVEGRVKLRVLVDRASLEVFGNDGLVSLSSCFVPSPAEKGLEAYAVGGPAKLVSLRVWPLRSAWKTAGRPERPGGE